ncbi:Vps52 / Sac2 family [Novymonas esmeraldas]|uniref:Vps52 / Sac2 family n=1 Tax=Novymonas esmeraldas TaxID=1808958 RepID=A0AAW0EUT1_9TRYP
MSGGGNEAENAELALYRLEEIDELLATVSHDEDASQSATLAQYLRSGEDLESTLRQHDEQLRRLRDAYVAAHVDQAELIAQLYHEFSGCEAHIVGFEEEILTFQRQLEGNANDIVYMQQQTDGLVRKVNNRRQVSNKINEVYSALQKCDSFCDVISNKDVDATYLANLRELDRRLAFLSRNKALQHSAVDNQIRPKLTAAAYKAGDKLQRFLTKKILALAEDPSQTVDGQQALEESAQFAFRFLQLYNAPVAKEITKLYIRYMSESYTKQFRLLLTQFSEASAVHADPLEPLVSAEEVREVASNRDAGAPSGSQVNPPPMNFPGRTLARRERSVSQHMRGFTDLITAHGAASKAESLRLLRAATFQDCVMAVNALSVRYGKLYVDDAIAAQLGQCNSWAWQFVCCFRALVNSCESECRFIGNFFCVAGDVEGGEDYASAERIARAVLGRAVGNVEASIVDDLPLVMERSEVLAALRVLETVKQHLCTSLDPIPLLLLSGVLEMSKSALRASLRTAFKNDELALAFLPTLKLSPFHRTSAKAGGWADIVGNKPYCATLGPHPLVYRVCGVLGQLVYLNTTALRSSAFAGGNQRAFDPSVAAFVTTCLAHMMSFVDQLKRRHSSPLAQQVFACVNIFTVVATWRELTAPDGATASPAPSRPASPAGNVNRGGANGARSHFDAVGGGAASAEVAAAPSGASSHAQYLESQLQDAILGWVRAEQESGEASWGRLLAFVSDAAAALGPDFFNAAVQTPSTARQHTTTATAPVALPPLSSLPDTLNEGAVLAVATELNAHWQTQAKATVEAVRKAVQLSLGRAIGGSGGGSAAAAEQQRRQCEELSGLVLNAHFSALADANRKLAFFVAQYYSGNRDLQSKLVNHTTVVHELSRVLESDS